MSADEFSEDGVAGGVRRRPGRAAVELRGRSRSRSCSAIRPARRWPLLEPLARDTAACGASRASGSTRPATVRCSLLQTRASGSDLEGQAAAVAALDAGVRAARASPAWRSSCRARARWRCRVARRRARCASACRSCRPSACSSCCSSRTARSRWSRSASCPRRSACSSASRPCRRRSARCTRSRSRSARRCSARRSTIRATC